MLAYMTFQPRSRSSANYRYCEAHSRAHDSPWTLQSSYNDITSAVIVADEGSIC